jgi:predicted GTPase
LEQSKENVKRFKERFNRKIIEISAKENVNLDRLIDEIHKKLQ